MGKFKFVRFSLCTLACIGLLMPQVAMAAPNGTHASPKSHLAAHDVTLGIDGKLQGQVVDPQGAELAGHPVVLINNGKAIASTKTDQRGNFEFSLVRGGTYQLETIGALGNYRIWPRTSAPPSATGKVLMVQNAEVIRAQNGALAFFGTPLGLATIGCGIAAAVALPIALADDDDAS